MRKPETMLEVLQVIEDLAARNPYEARKLWWVLTALRGPDTGDDTGDVKRRTTAVIRGVAVPQLALAAGADVDTTADVEELQPLSYGAFEGAKCVGAHFKWHVASAAVTLRNTLLREQELRGQEMYPEP